MVPHLVFFLALAKPAYTAWRDATNAAFSFPLNARSDTSDLPTKDFVPKTDFVPNNNFVPNKDFISNKDFVLNNSRSEKESSLPDGKSAGIFNLNVSTFEIGGGEWGEDDMEDNIKNVLNPL
eukprot:1368046-Amorphochlora_amoeboformis.AAC.1